MRTPHVSECWWPTHMVTSSSPKVRCVMVVIIHHTTPHHITSCHVMSCPCSCSCHGTCMHVVWGFQALELLCRWGVYYWEPMIQGGLHSFLHHTLGSAVYGKAQFGEMSLHLLGPSPLAPPISALHLHQSPLAFRVL